MQIGIFLSIISVLCLTFYLGKIHERVEWNKLIKKGILPKPKKDAHK